jgi:hypothetical protein
MGTNANARSDPGNGAISAPAIQAASGGARERTEETMREGIRSTGCRMSFADACGVEIACSALDPRAPLRD